MFDFVFLSPFWLLALPLIALGYYYLKRQQQQQGLIAPHLAKALGLVAGTHRHLILLGFCIAWTLAIVALAAPSTHSQYRPSYQSQAARVLILDMSASMYATDLAPNRLTQLRYKVLDLLALWQEGVTGVVAYAGDAYTISPLTRDQHTIANLLPSLSPDIMPYSGSNAGQGVKLAIEMLENAGYAQGELILFSDDLNQEEQDQIQSLINNRTWQFSVFALGTPSGAPIVQSDGTLLKTERGDTVIAKTPLAKMRHFTQQLGGRFITYRPDNQDIAQLASSDHTSSAHTQENSPELSERFNQGYWLLFPLLPLVLLLFRRGIILMALLTLSLPFYPSSAQASAWQTANQQGFQTYQQGEYALAAKQFQDPAWQGAAYYQAGEFKKAIQVLSQISDPDLATQYNLANAYAQAGELSKAKTLYEAILSKEPNYPDTKENLALVKQALAQSIPDPNLEETASSSNNETGENTDSATSSDTKQNEPNTNNEQEAPTNTPENAESTPKESTNRQDSTSNTPESNAANNEAQHSEPATEQFQDQDSQHSKKTGTSASHNADTTQALSRPLSAPNEASSSEADQFLISSQANSQNSAQLRRLEQVELARDPSALLKAQLLLQAKEKPQPKAQGKPW